MSPQFHRSSASLKLRIKLLCNGTYTHFKGRGCSVPFMKPRSGVPAEINRYQIPKQQKGALWSTTNLKVVIIIRSSSHQLYKHSEIIGMHFKIQSQHAAILWSKHPLNTPPISGSVNEQSFVVPLSLCTEFIISLASIDTDS